MSLEVCYPCKGQDLAPAAESLLFPASLDPSTGLPSPWAQGDRLSIAATRLSYGHAVSVPASSLGRRHLADFSGRGEGKRPPGWREPRYLAPGLLAPPPARAVHRRSGT